MSEGEQPPVFPGIGELTGGLGVDLQDMALVMMVVKLTQTPGGMKLLQTLGKSFIDGVFKTLGYLAQATAANRISAWGGNILISQVLARFRFVRQDMIPNYHLGLTLIAGAGVTQDFVSAVAQALPWNMLSKPPDANFPDQITFAAESPASTTFSQPAEWVLPKQTEKKKE